MRWWWVNQSQTHQHELSGGYLWSPKLKANGDRNPFYEFMREVAPGDLVFSYAQGRILAYGLARSNAYEAPKPAEFGAAGRNWSQIGWRIDVAYTRLATVFRPSEWMERLRPLLPARYAPLRANGHGLQSMYLTQLPEVFALALADLLGNEVAALARAQAVLEQPLSAPNQEIALWERHLQHEIERSASIPETEKEALVLARRGQGLFRRLVQEREPRCRITGVERAEHLRASHCKPWRDCTDNRERLDPDNGLMLTPSIDHLFDRGFISFEQDGRVLVSPVAHAESLRRMGVPSGRELRTEPFRHEQRAFLEYHRDLVFLKSRVRA